MNFADYILILASACQTFVERTEASTSRDRLAGLDAIDRDLAVLRKTSDAYGDLILKLLDDRDSHREALRAADATLRDISARLATIETVIFGKSTDPRASASPNAEAKTPRDAGASARPNAEPSTTGNRPPDPSVRGHRPTPDPRANPLRQQSSVSDQIQSAIADFQATFPDWARIFATGMQRIANTLDEHPTTHSHLYDAITQLLADFDIPVDTSSQFASPHPTDPSPHTTPTPPPSADPAANVTTDAAPSASSRPTAPPADTADPTVKRSAAPTAKRSTAPAVDRSTDPAANLTADAPSPTASPRPPASPSDTADPAAKRSTEPEADRSTDIATITHLTADPGPAAALATDLLLAARGAFRDAVFTLRDAGLSSETARGWFIAGTWSRPRQRTAAQRAARGHLGAVTSEFGRRGTDELARTIEVYTSATLWKRLWDLPSNVTPIRRVAEG